MSEQQAIRLLISFLTLPAFLGIVAVSSASAAQSWNSKCQDVRYIGVRGSDEDPGMGTAVQKTANVFKQGLGGKATATLDPLVYPAVSVPELLLQFAKSAESQSVEDGETSLLATLDNKCDKEQIVLVGYSQGAMVVKNTLNRGDLPEKVRDRITAVALLADPIFSIKDRTKGLAKKVLGAFHLGVFARAVSLHRTSLPDFVANKATLCNEGDLVCGRGTDEVIKACAKKAESAIAEKKSISQKWDEFQATCFKHHQTYDQTSAESVGKWLAAVVLKKKATPPMPEPTPNPGPQRPDLKITSLSGPSGSICPGDRVQVAGVIRNEGKGVSGEFAFQWNVNGKRSDKTADNLKPRMLTTRTYLWSSIPVGTYNVTLTADPKNSIAESDEKNNSKAVTLTVKSCAAEHGPIHVQATKGWQDTGIDISGKFNISYLNEGTWSVDFRNHPFVGPNGYSPEQDQKVAQGYKYDTHKPYGYLLGKLVWNGQEKAFEVGEGGLWENTFSKPARLYLRINDADQALGDNSGSVTMDVNPW